MDKIIDAFLIFGFLVILFLAVTQYLPTIHNILDSLTK